MMQPISLIASAQGISCSCATGPPAAGAAVFSMTRFLRQRRSPAAASLLSTRLTSHQQQDAGVGARQHGRLKDLSRSRRPFSLYFKTTFPCSPTYREAIWTALQGAKRGRRGARLKPENVAWLMTDPRALRTPLPWARGLLSHHHNTHHTSEDFGSPAGERNMHGGRSTLGPAPPTTYTRHDVVETVRTPRFSEDVLDKYVRTLLDIRFDWDREDGVLAMALLPQRLYPFTEHTRPYGKVPKALRRQLAAASRTSHLGSSSWCPAAEENTREAEENEDKEEEEEEEDLRVPARFLYLRDGRRIPLYSGHPKHRFKRAEFGYHGVEAVPSLVLDAALGPLLCAPACAALGWRWTAANRQATQVQTALQAQQVLASHAAAVLALGPRTVFLLLKAIASCEVEHPGLSVALGVAITEHYHSYNHVECLEVLRCLRRLALMRYLPHGMQANPPPPAATASITTTTTTTTTAAAAVLGDDGQHVGPTRSPSVSPEVIHPHAAGSTLPPTIALTEKKEEEEEEAEAAFTALYDTDTTDLIAEAFGQYVEDVMPQLTEKVWQRLPEQAARLRRRGLFLDWIDLLSLATELASVSSTFSGSGSLGGGCLPVSAALLNLEGAGISIHCPPRSPALQAAAEVIDAASTAERHGSSRRAVSLLEDEDADADHHSLPRATAGQGRAGGARHTRRYFYLRYALQLDVPTVEMMMKWLRPTRSNTAEIAAPVKKTNEEAEASQSSSSSSSSSEAASSGPHDPLVLWRAAALLVRSTAEALGDLLCHVADDLALLVQVAAEYATDVAAREIPRNIHSLADDQHECGGGDEEEEKGEGEDADWCLPARLFDGVSAFSPPRPFDVLQAAYHRLTTAQESSRATWRRGARRLRVIPLAAFPRVARWALQSPTRRLLHTTAGSRGGTGGAAQRMKKKKKKPQNLGLSSKSSTAVDLQGDRGRRARWRMGSGVSPLSAALREAPELADELRRTTEALRWGSGVLRAVWVAVSALPSPTPAAGMTAAMHMHDPEGHRQVLCFGFTKGVVQGHMDRLLTHLPWGGGSGGVRGEEGKGFFSVDGAVVGIEQLVETAAATAAATARPASELQPGRGVAGEHIHPFPPTGVPTPEEQEEEEGSTNTNTAASCLREDVSRGCAAPGHTNNAMGPLNALRNSSSSDQGNPATPPSTDPSGAATATAAALDEREELFQSLLGDLQAELSAFEEAALSLYASTATNYQQPFQSRFGFTDRCSLRACCEPCHFFYFYTRLNFTFFYLVVVVLVQERVFIYIYISIKSPLSSSFTSARTHCCSCAQGGHETHGPHKIIYTTTTRVRRLVMLNEDITDPPLIHSWIQDALGAFSEELQELQALADAEEQDYQHELDEIRNICESGDRVGSMSGRANANRNGPKRAKGCQQDEATLAAVERERAMAERLDTLQQTRERMPSHTLCCGYEKELKIAQLSVEPVKQRERRELDFFRSHHTEHFSMDEILDGTRFPIPKIKAPALAVSHPGTGAGSPSSGSRLATSKGNCSPRRGGGGGSSNPSGRTPGSPRRESRSNSMAGLNSSKRHVTLDVSPASSSRRTPTGADGNGSESSAAAAAAAAAAATAAAAAAIASTPDFIIDALAFARQHNQTLSEQYGYKPVLNANSGLVESPPPESSVTLTDKLKTHKPGVDCALPPFFTETYPPTDHMPEPPSEFASNLPMSLKQFYGGGRSSSGGSSASNSAADDQRNGRSPSPRASPGITAAAGGRSGKAAARNKAQHKGASRNTSTLHLGIECSAKNQEVVLRACTHQRATTVIRFTNRNADRHRLRVHPSTDPWLVYTCTCMAPVAGRVERNVRYEMPVSCGGYIEVEVAFKPEHMFEAVIDTVLQIGITKERNARNAEGGSWSFYEVRVRCETVLPKPQLYSFQGAFSPAAVVAAAAAASSAVASSGAASAITTPRTATGTARGSALERALTALPPQPPSAPPPPLAAAPPTEDGCPLVQQPSATGTGGGGGGSAWLVDVSSVAVSSSAPSSTTSGGRPSMPRSFLSRSSSRTAGGGSGSGSGRPGRDNSSLTAAAGTTAPPAPTLRLFPVERIEFPHTFVMATTTTSYYIENVGSDAMLTLKSTCSSFRILPHPDGAVAVLDDVEQLSADVAHLPQSAAGRAPNAPPYLPGTARGRSNGSPPLSHAQTHTREGGRQPEPTASPPGSGGRRSHGASTSSFDIGRPNRGSGRSRSSRSSSSSSRRVGGERWSCGSPSELAYLHQQGVAGKGASAPFILQQMEGTTFTLSFQPREEGEVHGQLEVTVQETRGGDVVARHYYDLVGAGVVPRLQLTRIGDVVVEPSDTPQWRVDDEEELIPHYFVQHTTPNVASEVTVELQNLSMVRLPFHWQVEGNRTLLPNTPGDEQPQLDATGSAAALVSGDGQAPLSSSSDNDDDASGISTSVLRRAAAEQARLGLARETEIAIEPRCGVLEPGSIMHFTVSVTPHQPVPLVTSFALFIEGLPDPDDPNADAHTRRKWAGVDPAVVGLFRRGKLVPSARLCHGTPEEVAASIWAKVERGHTPKECGTDPYADPFGQVRRFVAPQDTQKEPETFSTGFFIYLQPEVPTAVMVPQRFTESVDCLIHYENCRRATLHNRSPRPLHFVFDPTPAECGGRWPPHDPTHVTVRAMPRCGVLPPFSSKPITVKFTVHHSGEHHQRINLYFPEVMELAPPGAPCSHTVELDVVGVGASVHTSTGMLDFGLIEMGKEAQASFTVTNDNPVAVMVDLQDPMMRKPPRFVFIPPSFQLCPGDSIEVTVYRKAVSLEDAQTFFELVVRNGGTIAMETRATIQDPTLVLDGALLQFGAVPEGVWQESQFFVSNLSAMDNPFTLKLASPPSPYLELEFARHHTIRAGQRHCGVTVRARFKHHPEEAVSGAADCYRALLGLRSQRNQQVLLVELRCEAVHQLTISVDMAVICTSTSVKAMTASLQHFLPYQHAVRAMNETHTSTDLTVRNAVMVRHAHWQETPTVDYIQALLWNLIEEVLLQVGGESQRQARSSSSSSSLQSHPSHESHGSSEHRLRGGEDEAPQETGELPTAGISAISSRHPDNSTCSNHQQHSSPHRQQGSEGPTPGAEGSTHSLKRSHHCSSTTKSPTTSTERHRKRGSTASAKATAAAAAAAGGRVMSLEKEALEDPLMAPIPRPLRALCATLVLTSQLAGNWPVTSASFALGFQNYTGCISAYEVEVLQYRQWDYVLDTYLSPDGGPTLNGGSTLGTTQKFMLTNGGTVQSTSIGSPQSLGGYSAGEYSAASPSAAGSPQQQQVGDGGRVLGNHHSKGRNANSPLRLTDGTASAVPLLQGEGPSFWTTLMNGVEARERANKQALAGAQERLLDGRGCSTLQCSPQGPIRPFDRVQLPLMMVTNLPGRYEETVRVHFDGLRPPIDLPVRWEVEGKPLLLDPTTSGLTTCGHHDLLLMPSVIASVGTSQRHLRLINRIPRDLNVEVYIYLCSATFQVDAVDASADASQVTLRLMPLTGEAKTRQSIGKGNASVSPATFFIKANSTKEIWLEYEPDIQVVQPVLDRLRGAGTIAATLSAIANGASVCSSTPATSCVSAPATRSSSTKTGLAAAAAAAAAATTTGAVGEKGGSGEGAEPTTASQEIPWDGSVVIHAEIAESPFNDSFLIDEFYEIHKDRYPSVRSLEGLRAGVVATHHPGENKESILSRVSMLKVRRPLRSRQHVVRKNRVLFPSPAERYILERAMLAKGFRLCAKQYFACNRLAGGGNTNNSTISGGGGTNTMLNGSTGPMSPSGTQTIKGGTVNSWLANTPENMEELLRAPSNAVLDHSSGQLGGSRGGTPPLDHTALQKKKQKQQQSNDEDVIPDDGSGADDADSSEDEVDDSVAMLEAMAGGMRPIEDLLREEEERRELLLYLLRRRAEVRCMSHQYFTPIELLVRARCGVPCLDVQPSMDGVFFPTYHQGQWCGRTVRLTNYNSAAVYLALETDTAFCIVSLNLIPSQVESDPLGSEDEPDIMEGNRMRPPGRHDWQNPPATVPSSGGGGGGGNAEGYPLGNNQLSAVRKDRPGRIGAFPFATTEMDGRLVYRLQCGDALNVTMGVRDPERQAALTDPLYRKRLVLQGRLMLYFYDGSLRGKNKHQGGEGSAAAGMGGGRALPGQASMGTTEGPTGESNTASGAFGATPPRSVCTQEAKKNREHRDSPMPLVLQMGGAAAAAQTATGGGPSDTTTGSPQRTPPRPRWTSSPPPPEQVGTAAHCRTGSPSARLSQSSRARTLLEEEAPVEMGRQNALAEQQVRLFVPFTTATVFTTPLATWFKPGQLVHDGRPQPVAVQEVRIHNRMDEAVRFRIIRVPRAQALRDEFAKPVLAYITTLGVQGAKEHLTAERKMKEVTNMPPDVRPAEGEQGCLLVDEPNAFVFSTMEGVIPPATMGGMPGMTPIYIQFHQYSNVRYECFYRLLINDKPSDNYILVRGDSRETEV
eukprot:gene13444-9255_t